MANNMNTIWDRVESALVGGEKDGLRQVATELLKAKTLAEFQEVRRAAEEVLGALEEG